MSQEPKTEIDRADREQLSLFDKGEAWQNEWQGMPEFVQEDQKPYRSVVVHFEKERDVQAFAKLIGQKITSKCHVLWYPEAVRADYSQQLWVDAE